MTNPKLWLTEETPPRVLEVKGRSAVDPDCLVATVMGQEWVRGLWIVHDGAAEPKRCYVCGIDTYASPIGAVQ
jgi:hypothetical protein